MSNNENISSKENSKLELDELYRLLDLYDSPNTNTTEKEAIYSKLSILKSKLIKSNSKNNIFPNTNNVDFVNKILTRGEFSVNKSINKSKRSDIDDFLLAQNQIFIKKLISPNTPYRSLMLYHMTGTGKSCSSAQIVENFKKYFTKRALIVLQPGLQDNYRTELFNITKYEIKNDNMKQCLGNEYLHQISNRKKLDLNKIEKSAYKLIKDNYEFSGYGQLGNTVQKEIVKYGADTPGFIASMDRIFSDRVIVIDEIHNMKNSGDDDSKLSALYLHKYILKYSKNTVLVLLSATPMYDTPEEIIWLMNTLLLNDKREPVSYSTKIFDENNEITLNFKNILEKWANNYISYMRGENPINFPLRLYPSVNKDKAIYKPEEYYKKDINNQTIPATDNIQHLELMKINMSKQQEDIYFKKKEQQKKILEIGVDDNVIGEKKGKNIIFDLSQISNIIYPRVSNTGDFVEQCYGDLGFANTFEIDTTDKESKYKVKYKENALNCLDKDNIYKYSPKIDRIIKYIKNSTGIVFVYSRFLKAGVIPLAIALEQQGYSKYSKFGGTNILSKTTNTNIEPSNKLKYMVISGNSPAISSHFINELEVLKSPANNDGSIIKIVLVTTKGIEGLDFKNIREIHILEPWFNLSRIQQIIGRGIRNNSHITLAENLRNTTIYQYVNCTNSDSQETIDFRMYRLSEKKQKRVSKIERILKENSIDCNLTREVLTREQSTRDIITSQNISTTISIGDINNSKECDYQNCEIVCKPKVKITKEVIKNKNFIEYETDYTKKFIKFYLNKSRKLYFNLDEIIDFYKKNINENLEILYNALYQLESKKEIFKIKEVSGYLIYRSSYYIFQPLLIDDTKITIEDRQSKQKFLPEKVSLKRHVKKIIVSENKNNIIVPNINSKISSDILNKILDDCKLSQLLNTIEKSKIFKTVNLKIVYSMAIDRLSVENRDILLKYIAIGSNIDKNFKEALKTNKLYIFKNDLLVSYYDVFETKDRKYKTFNKNNLTFETSNVFDDIENRKEFYNNISTYIRDKEINKYGFIDIDQKNKKLSTKIYDNVNIKKKSTGTSCNFYNKANLIALFNLFNIDITIVKLKKHEICDTYEYLLRKENNEIIKFLTADIQIYLKMKGEINAQKKKK